MFAGMAKKTVPKIQNIPIELLKKNPSNPRIIRDSKFKKLVESIKQFPEMLELRPIIVNKKMVILGGNMRFKAAVEAGLKTIPTIITNLSKAKENEFIIKDNVSSGEWDDDLLKIWDDQALADWGFEALKKGKEVKFTVKEPEQKWFLNIELQNEKETEKWFKKLTDEGLTVKIIN